MSVTASHNFRVDTGRGELQLIFSIVAIADGYRVHLKFRDAALSGECPEKMPGACSVQEEGIDSGCYNARVFKGGNNKL